ncbi:hypothetical protein [Microbacterium aurum]
MRAADVLDLLLVQQPAFAGVRAGGAAVTPGGHARFHRVHARQRLLDHLETEWRRPTPCPSVVSMAARDVLVEFLGRGDRTVDIGRGHAPLREPAVPMLELSLIELMESRA